MAAVSNSAKELLQLGDLIQSSIRTFVEAETSSNRAEFQSWEFFDSKRLLIAAAGKLIELASDPSSRLQEMCVQYFESRALHIVADLRVPDILAKADEGGLHLGSLSEKTGIEPGKLCMPAPLTK
jgi:hypothetical protein